ncbi:hypothetical protein [Shimia sp. SDUM112013]|uniref:hypothetical protein n=1 Tax=Shimia sp. SDUM112013 TaxID=3136160 RepID=UPI0032EA97C3
MPEYTLYYWPIPFRGHLVRYVLAYVGATWQEPPIEDLVDLKVAPLSEQPVPFMAPPILHDHGADLWVAQAPAVLAYLGQKYALIPQDPQKAALTLKLLGDSIDVLEGITRACGAQMWDKPSWADFAAHRLPRWMAIYEETARRYQAKGTDTLLGTEAPGLADLVSAALWFTMTDKLPQLAPLLKLHAPRVAEQADLIAHSSQIAAMRAAFERDDMGTYCSGQIEASLKEVLADWTPDKA